MQKTEFVAKVAEKAGLSKKDTLALVNAYHEVLVDSMKRCEKVVLKEFGSFEAKPRAARSGRNPRTKEEIIIPASVVVKFKPSKVVSDALNTQ